MSWADEGDPTGRYIWFITPRRSLAITSADIDRPLHNVGYNKQQLGSDWWDDMLKGHPATSGPDAQFNSRCLTRLICMLAPAVIPKQTWHMVYFYTHTHGRAPAASCASLQIKWWQLIFLQTTDSFLCVCHTNCLDIFVQLMSCHVYMNLCELTGSQEVERNQECSSLSCILTFVSLTPVDVFKQPLRHFPIVTESQNPFRHIFDDESGCYQLDLQTFPAMSTVTKAGILSQNMNFSEAKPSIFFFLCLNRL